MQWRTFTLCAPPRRPLTLPSPSAEQVGAAERVRAADTALGGEGFFHRGGTKENPLPFAGEGRVRGRRELGQTTP